MGVTIGCLTRVYIGEIPYIRSFIEHHRSIGIDMFYFVFASLQGFEHIEDVIAEYKDSCEFIIEKDGRNPNQALLIDTSIIKTDYVAIIDMDEFIYVDGDASLRDFLDQRDHPVYAMKWIMAPRDFETPTGQITGFRGHHGKRIALTSMVRGVKSPHNFEYEEKIKPHRDKTLRLAHYWGRSFQDIVIKCAYQMLPGLKMSSVQQMEEGMKTRTLPERLKVLASLTSHKQDITLKHENHELIDRGLETEILSVVSPALLDDLEGAYRDYKSQLDYDRNVGIYPDEGTIYDLARRLP